MGIQQSKQTTIPETDAPDAFVSDLDSAYSTFRISLVQLLHSSGIDPRSGSAIAAELSVNRQLAWQLATIAAESACSVGLNALPGSRGIQIFVNACRRHLGEHAAINELQASVVTLERAVRRHAGDRASLGLLTAAWDPKQVENRTETLRRDGYRAQCALLGVQVATQVRGVIYAPSRRNDPATVSMATYQCFTDLIRLRRDRACRLLFVEAPTHDDGSLAMPVEEMTAHMHEKFELDESLSSGGADDIEILVEGARGWVTLRPGLLGRTAASRWVFTGSARYEHPRYRSEADIYNQVGIVTHVPTETVYIDCLMDRSLAEHVDLEHAVEASCFDASTGQPMRPASKGDPAYLFDLEQPTLLSPTELACDASVPALTEIVDQAARRVGCRVDDLVGVRFRTRYVMSPMEFIVSRTLPRRPG